MVWKKVGCGHLGTYYVPGVLWLTGAMMVNRNIAPDLIKFIVC